MRGNIRDRQQEENNMLEKVFKLKENHTDVKTEILAGITTFLTMSYILAVNPSILGVTGMDKGAVFTATATASLIATLIMAVWAKLPFALAPGMGLNAFFAFTVCLGMGNTWEFALTAVLIEGILFILLTLSNLRVTYKKSKRVYAMGNPFDNVDRHSDGNYRI